MFLVLSKSETKYTVAPTPRRCSNTVPHPLFGRFSGDLEPAKNPCAVVLNVRRVPVKDSFSAEKKRQVQKSMTDQWEFNFMKLHSLAWEGRMAVENRLSSLQWWRYLGLIRTSHKCYNYDLFQQLLAMFLFCFFTYMVIFLRIGWLFSFNCFIYFIAK